MRLSGTPPGIEAAVERGAQGGAVAVERLASVVLSATDLVVVVGKAASGHPDGYDVPAPLSAAAQGQLAIEVDRRHRQTQREVVAHEVRLVDVVEEISPLRTRSREVWSMPIWIKRRFSGSTCPAAGDTSPNRAKAAVSHALKRLSRCADDLIKAKDHREGARNVSAHPQSPRCTIRGQGYVKGRAKPDSSRRGRDAVC